MDYPLIKSVFRLRSVFLLSGTLFPKKQKTGAPTGAPVVFCPSVQFQNRFPYLIKFRPDPFRQIRNIV